MTGYRFYGELAVWWPLISPVEEYEEEAGEALKVLNSASIPVREALELGSGGGHNAIYLKNHFQLTLVDLSEEMLEMSRRLNPECEHLQGDMRTMRLGREFGAVFVHDAIDYMTTVQDLRLAIETAYAHCRPGGLALLIPDNVAENFEPSTDHGGADGADGRALRYLEWTWDPDPDDSWTQTEYAFVLKDPDGSMRLLHESHRTGLFPREVWLRLMAEAGFEPEILLEETTEDRSPRDFLVGRRPA